MSYQSNISKHTSLKIIAGQSGSASFVWGSRGYLWIIIAASILQFAAFKFLYPFPDFISDSYSYIMTELLGLKVNLWPVGYSKYLGFIHYISHSDTFLIFTQYLLLQCSLSFFFFTFIALFRTSRISRLILFIFLFFNPIFIYLSNCVLSDALFCSLSVIWMTEMLRMIQKPRSYHIIMMAVLVGILFTIRYTAIYYPLITAIAFMLSKFTLWKKILGAAGPLLIIVPFVIYTQQKTKEITGTAEFSVFGGWQIANNSLYMYDHIEVDPKTLPESTWPLDTVVKQYFHVVPPEYRELDPFPGTFFIKMSNAPLKVYMHSKFSGEDSTGGMLSWGTVSPVYNTYGTYLIKKHPFKFARYYLWLNTKNYFIPHLEKFSRYNLDTDSVWWPAVTWFHYDSPEITVLARDLQSKLFAPYPVLFFMLNVLFVGSFVVFIRHGGVGKQHSLMTATAWLAASFLFLNFCFSVFATPVVLRYQIVPMIILISTSIILLEEMELILAKKRSKI